MDFASATDYDQALQSLTWAQDEIVKKAEQNNLPRLIQLRQGKPIDLAGVELGVSPGIARAKRAQIGLASDRPVGGLAGISRLFADDDQFTPSSAGEDILRGFQGFSKELPVVVVKDEGPVATHSWHRGRSAISGDGSREAPIADIYSDRQAVGRKFAAEFIAPAEGVVISSMSKASR